MPALNLVLLAAGLILLLIGAQRARGPYGRLQQLRATQANLDRYEGWRGARRSSVDEGPSSAELMMAELGRQVRRWGLLAALGILLLLVGLIWRA